MAVGSSDTKQVDDDDGNDYEVLEIETDVNEYAGKAIKAMLDPSDPRAARAKDHTMHTFSNICNRDNRLKGCDSIRPLLARQQLKQISLLGCVLVISGKMYALCPQFACGRLMVFDPEKCVNTRRGFACALCSDVIRADRIRTHQPNSSLSVLLERVFQDQSCTLCARALKSRVDAFVYPCDVLLCRRCNRHKKAYVAICQEHPELQSVEHQPKLMELIDKHRQVVREQFAERNAGFRKQAMLQVKRKDRARRR